MKFLRFISTCATAAVLLEGCIRNDIPETPVPGVIIALEADGAECEIDGERRCVMLNLAEETDIRNVTVRKVEFNDSGVQSSLPLAGTHDLRSDLKFVLSTRNTESTWTLGARQEIRRWFTLGGQVGKTFIDEVNRRIVLKVSSDMNRKQLDITSIHLGPESLVSYSPDPSTIHDFSNGQEITVRCHGREEVGTIYVEKTETVVELLGIDPWSRVAWVRASGIAGQKNGFRYRMKGEEELIEVPDVK